MKTACSLLLLVSACYAAAADPQAAWKIDSEPALTPGMIGEWDDFAITTPSVVRLPDKWLMLYEGINFTESGMHRAFGIAESKDGVKWMKHSQNPILQPELAENEVCSSSSITRWHNEFRLAYSVFSEPFRSDPVSGKPGDGFVSARVMRSSDGLNWTVASSVTSAVTPRFFWPLRTSLYGDDKTLNLWWLDQAGGKDVLDHAVSRDGETWSKPNVQTRAEIDSRQICCARVYPSGDFFILSYVTWENHDRVHHVVTKISSNGRTWASKGPPEFLLPSHDENHHAPLLMFESGGARLFYCEEGRDNRVSLRSAYCRKENYAGQ